MITHTIHFLSLLTFYLGIKLPFEISWSGEKLGVGQPSIGAGRGTELGGWAKYDIDNPRFYICANLLSSGGTRNTLCIFHPPIPHPPHRRRIPLPRISPAPNLTDRIGRSSSPNRTRSLTPPHRHLSQLRSRCYSTMSRTSHLPRTSMCRSARPGTSSVTFGAFAAALSSEGTHCLSCTLDHHLCSSYIYRKSHETTPPLPAPTPPTFSLDFAQLLQATTAHPASRVRSRPSKTRRLSAAHSGRKEGPIVEEDDGWDLVDGDDDFS